MKTHPRESTPALSSGEGTIIDLFLEGVGNFPSRPAYRSRGQDGWSDVSYGEVAERVRCLAVALRAMGMVRGDRAVILSENRIEWALADYACLCAGIVDVPVYPSLTAPQIRYILNDSGARLAFASSAEQLGKLEEIRSECPELESVVVFDPPAALPPGTTSWSRLIGGGASPGARRSPEAFRTEAERARPGDVATILYTSGTTGDPKGVMLTHDNLHSNVRACAGLLPLGSSDSTLSFLPLSHVLQRMADYLFFHQGCPVAYARSIQLVTEDLREVRPTLVVSVPRLYEKVYASVRAAEGLKRRIVDWSIRAGAAWAEARLAGRRPGLGTRLGHGLADRILFRKIRAAVGGRLRFFVSGGAPLSPEINRFFFSAGLTILEGYGLTETSPVLNLNSARDFPRNFRVGTVGKPIPGTEERIAADGEILVRGPQVMKGYYNLPGRTAEALDPEGWFHTGDIGDIDGDGFLRITDRKKDIIVTAGGKNVAPQPIENTLTKNRFVDQPVLIGDRRKFIVLLLAPDFEALESWAREDGGAGGADRRALLELPRVQKLLSDEIFGDLGHLSRVETPKKLLLLDRGFTIPDGSLTPTHKVKRRVVEARYARQIDALYGEENEGQTVFTAW